SRILDTAHAFRNHLRNSDALASETHHRLSLDRQTVSGKRELDWCLAGSKLTIGLIDMVGSQHNCAVSRPACGCHCSKLHSVWYWCPYGVRLGCRSLSAPSTAFLARAWPPADR